MLSISDEEERKSRDNWKNGDELLVLFKDKWYEACITKINDNYVTVEYEREPKSKAIKIEHRYSLKFKRIEDTPELQSNSSSMFSDDHKTANLNPKRSIKFANPNAIEKSFSSFIDDEIVSRFPYQSCTELAHEQKKRKLENDLNWIETNRHVQDSSYIRKILSPTNKPKKHQHRLSIMNLQHNQLVKNKLQYYETTNKKSNYVKAFDELTEQDKKQIRYQISKDLGNNVPKKEILKKLETKYTLNLDDDKRIRVVKFLNFCINVFDNELKKKNQKGVEKLLTVETRKNIQDYIWKELSDKKEPENILKTLKGIYSTEIDEEYMKEVERWIKHEISWFTKDMKT